MKTVQDKNLLEMPIGVFDSGMGCLLYTSHLRQVDAAYRNVSVAGVCHHELSGPVSDGRVVCSDGNLGRRCTDRILFDRTGGVESGLSLIHI